MNKKLGMFSFYTITSAMVMSVYVYPTFATAGLGLVFFLAVSGLLWFIPTALCSAEMASVDAFDKGGIFIWVKQTLGEKWAFIAVFFQWFQVTIGFVSMLYFIVGMLSVALDLPILNDNIWAKLTTMIIIFWIVSLAQFLGNKITAIISKIGFLFGVLMPVIVLAILTIMYIQSDGTIHIDLSLQELVPDFNSMNSLVVFVSFILAYLGIEASANEIHNLKDSSKSYPRVIIIFCITSILINMIAGLSIAILVPLDQINLSTGIIQAFQTAVNTLIPDYGFIVTIIGIIMTLSTIAKISTWIVAPSEGLYESAKLGLLPQFFLKENKNKIPVNIVLMQSVIATIWVVVLTLTSTHGNLAFLLSLALTVITYLMAYLLMYLAYFKLVLKHASFTRGYEAFTTKSKKMILGGIGFITTVFAFVLSFYPPDNYGREDQIIYLLVLVVSFVVISLLPIIIYRKMRGNTNEK